MADLTWRGHLLMMSLFIGVFIGVLVLAYLAFNVVSHLGGGSVTP